MSDDAIFGQKPVRHFAFESPLLLRISRARYLNVSIVEGDPGLGVLRPWLDGKGDFDWTTGDAKLVEGDLLTVRGVAGPVDVTVGAEAGARAEARLRVTTNGPSRNLSLPSRERGTLAFRAFRRRAGRALPRQGRRGRRRAHRLPVHARAGGRSMTTRIDSASNPRIVAAVKAIASGEMMLLEGSRMIEEALDAGVRVEEVFVRRNPDEERK